MSLESDGRRGPVQASATKAALVADIENAWGALIATLEPLSDSQITERRDARGWSIKDHLVHLTTWERSVLFMLLRQSRYIGLGVDRRLYEEGSEDEINDAIYQRHRDMALLSALANFQEVHQQLVSLLASLDTSRLQESFFEYPGAKGADAQPSTVLDVVRANSAQHFAEHLTWIEALARSQGSRTLLQKPTS